MSPQSALPLQRAPDQQTAQRGSRTGPYAPTEAAHDLDEELWIDRQGCGVERELWQRSSCILHGKECTRLTCGLDLVIDLLHLCSWNPRVDVWSSSAERHE